MALMVLVSEWATFDLAYSLPKISGMVLAYGSFFAVAREGERVRGWRFSLLAFLVIGLGMAVVGLFGTRWATTKITLLDPIVGRLPKLIAGLQGAESGFHPNEVAGAVVWVLPPMITVSMGMFFASRTAQSSRKASGMDRETYGGLQGWHLAVVATLGVLSVLTVGLIFILTQSRGGYISLAATLPLLLLLALPPKWRWFSLILFVILATVLGVVTYTHWEAIRTWLTGSDLATDPALSLDTLEARVEIWSRAIYGIQDFPFTGMGMNAFRKVINVLYPLFVISPEMDIGHAHNEFLQAALDLGVPGLIALIAIYIIAFWMLFGMWKKGEGQNMLLPQKAIVLGLGGGLFAHLLFGLTDAVALGAKPGLLFWMLLGLIAGLYGQMHKKSNPATT